MKDIESIETVNKEIVNAVNDVRDKKEDALKELFRLVTIRRQLLMDKDKEK